MKAAIALAMGLVCFDGAARATEAVVHDGQSAPVAAWRNAMETGDIPALARMHDAGTIAFPPRSIVVKGGDAIMAGYKDLFANFTVSVRVDDAHWTEVPPLVVSWGLTILTLHPKAGGADIVSRTRFTDAAVRTSDGWRYLVDHASVQPGP